MQRLKTRSQFQAVLAGERVVASAHFTLHRCPLNVAGNATVAGVTGFPAKTSLFSHEGVWIGAMVPKRWARRAVTRNTIKRQIYTVSSQYESALPEAAHLVRLRSGFDRTSFSSASSEQLKRAVRLELEQLFSSAARRGTEGPSPRQMRC